MPRTGRKLSQSSVYHVMIRGNEKKDIFHDDADRKKFLDIVREKKKSGEFYLYAYCLMNNHVHLVIKEGTQKIAAVMKRINTSYAYYYNKKCGRVGHVLQDRFKSETIENDPYLLMVIKYVHNNPVKAKLVKNASEYSWSSYNLFINDRTSGSIVNNKEILGIFSPHYAKAMAMFIEFTASHSEKDEFMDCTDEINFKEKMGKARCFLDEYLSGKKITLESIKHKHNRELRNELIRELKKEYTLSVREIAGILGIDRNIVQRVVV